MATLAELIVRIGADATGLDRQLGKVENKIKRLGSNFEDVGKRLSTGLTLPLAGLGGIALKSAIDFESAFAGVRKTVDATDEQLAALRKGIRDMAKQMPASATEIARVAEAAGQLGIKTENILEFTRVMIDLGVSTNLSADQAATALARLANITQMPQEEFDRLGSTVVALGNNLATTEAEIVEMALRIAGAGKQVGMTEAQILSFAGALSSVGIAAEAGGSAISRAMIAIENAVQGGGEKLRLFAQVAGMSVADFKRAWEQDAAGALVAFIEGLGKLGQQGENVFPILEKLGLSEIIVRDALLRAANAGDLFRNSLEIGTKAWEENIALTKEAEQRYKTTESQLQILRNRLNDVAITLGDALIPALQDALTAAQPLIDAVTRMAEWFASLSPETQKFIITLVGIIALAGPFLMAIGAMINTISGIVGVVRLVIGAQGLGGLLTFGGKLMEAFALWRGGAGTFMEAMRLVVHPAGIWIAAIGAVIAVGYLLWRNWGSIKEFLINSWNAIKSTATQVWQSLATFLAATWERIKNVAVDAWEEIRQFFLDVRGVFTALWDVLTGGPTEVEYALEFLGQVFGGVFWYIGDVIARARTWFDQFVEYIKALPGRIAAILPQIPEIMAYWIGSAIGFVIRFFADLPENIHNLLVTFAKKVAEWFQRAKEWAVQNATALYQGVVNWVSQLPGRVTAFVTTMAQSVQQWFNTAKTWAVLRVTEMYNSVTSWIASLPGRIEGFLSTLASKVNEYFNRAKNMAITAATNLYTGVREAISRVPSIFSEIWDRIWSTISSWPGRLLEKARSIANAFWQGFKDGLGIHSPSYVERAFMAIEEQAWATMASLRQLVPDIRPLMARMVQPVRLALAADMPVAFEPVSLPAVGVERRGDAAPAPVQISQVHVTVHARDLREVEDVLNLFRGLRQAARAGV